MFGLAHLNSPDATALGLASNALGGVMYGAAFVRTGRNWTQGPVFGFNVSGASEWSESLSIRLRSGLT